MGDDSNPILWLIWIIPIVLFMFYGQRIQLQITSGDIKKNIAKLETFRNDSRKELLDYVKKELKTVNDPTKKIDQFIEYFTIPPVDMDPNGIIPKIKHIVRSREDHTRNQVNSLFTEINNVDSSKVQTLLEITAALQLIHKIVNHMFLTAKKQKNYPLILPLQMMMPFIMEEATALNESVSALKQGQPIGDSIGPMIVGQLMLDTEKQSAGLETVWSKKQHDDRTLYLLKAEGPASTVGRPGDAVESIILQNKINSIIMIDASLKMEGEDSAIIAQGFGAAIGGIGTERFQIEDVATKNNIPIYAIVIKESIKEAITLMTKDIANKSEEVKRQLFEMIAETTKPGESVLVIGVGNTIGVSQ